MTTPLRLIDMPTDYKHPDLIGGEPMPGAVWRNEDWDVDGQPPAYVVVLPNGAGLWVTTQTASGQFWTVEGEPPNITVSPSIDASPQWHGWIKNGGDGTVRLADNIGDAP